MFSKASFTSLENRAMIFARTNVTNMNFPAHPTDPTLQEVGHVHIQAAVAKTVVRGTGETRDAG